MILKNGKELIKPTEAQLKALKKYLDGHGHLVLDFHPSRGKVNPQKQLADPNNFAPIEVKMDYPPFFPLSTTQVVYNEDGTTDEYQYYITKTHDSKNKIDRYTPRSIRVRRSEIITDKEVQFFIVNFCSQVSNSVAGDQKSKSDANYTPWLQIVLEEQDAQKALGVEETVFAAKEVILRTGTEEALREIAAILGISNSKELSLALLKKELLNECKSRAKTSSSEAGYALFLEKYESVNAGKIDVEDKVASVMQKAIDEGVLSFSNESKSWLLREGEHEEGLLALNSSQVNSRNAVLARHLATSPSDVKKVSAALKDSKKELKKEK